MTIYECNCCDFSTKIKTHYKRHLETMKHIQRSKIIPLQPPTEIERLRIQVKQLMELVPPTPDPSPFFDSGL